METFSTSASPWEPPSELQRSTPRPVQLTRAGKIAAVAIAALAVAAVSITAWITNKSQEDARRWQAWRAEAVPAQGRVTGMHQISSGKNRSYAVDYTYRVDDTRYAGRSRINDREWRWLRQGDTIQVFYRRSEPGQSWMSGHEPTGVPSWVPLVSAIGPLLPVVLLAVGITRQKQLLAEGWPANARVTRVARTQQKGNVYQVEYEFQTMNGEAATGRAQMCRHIPLEGSNLTVLYLQDRPKRNAPYPMGLVKVRSEY